MATRHAFPPNDPTGDQIEIAGILIDPRLVVCKVRGLKVGINLDVKESPGVHGAALTFQGRKLGRWTIELRAGHEGGGEEFTAEEGYAVLESMAVEIIHKSMGGVVKTKTVGGVTTREVGCTPVAVKHPRLAARGITTAVFLDMEGPEQEDSLGYVVTIDCIQYAPPLKLNVSKPLQGDVLNGVPDTYSKSGAGPAPASTTSPQLPQPPSATPAKP